MSEQSRAESVTQRIGQRGSSGWLDISSIPFLSIWHPEANNSGSEFSLEIKFKSQVKFRPLTHTSSLPGMIHRTHVLLNIKDLTVMSQMELTTHPKR